MNSLLKLATPPRKSSLSANFVAFVADRNSEDLMQRFAQEQNIAHAYVQTGGIDEAIEHLSKMQRSPAQLIVDVSTVAMPLSELERLAAVCEPSVQVIVVGAANDVGLFRNLLEIGVQDYLVKPLTIELLRRAIGSGRDAQPLRQSRTGKAIGFTGTRGGVGVTTVATHLAHHLANAGRRIALVDLNLHGGAANSMLGLKSNNGLIDVLRDADRLDQQFVERSLVGRGNRLFMLSAELPYGEPFRMPDGALGEVIERLKPHFHYILLDIPGQGHALADAAIGETQVLYLVADPSIHSAREVLRLTRHIDNREKPPSTSVILNSPNAATAGRLKTVDFVGAIHRQVLLELPFDGAALATAENLGEPAPPGKSRYRDAIAALADSLSGRPLSTSSSWYTRLLSKRSL